MESLRTYLDHNATSPLRPEARAAMLEAMGECGNPSSVHAEGRRARGIVETAREAVADLVASEPRSVVFTSGGTEANNLAILGTPVDRIIASGVEHASVLEPARRSGKEVVVIGVDRQGLIDITQLDEALAAGRRRSLISLMLANNETGVIQPVGKVAGIAAKYGAILHTDAAQAVGKIDVHFGGLGADLMTLSGHKFGGPAGVGVLVVRDSTALDALISGGGQEFRCRAGSENVVGLAGFGAAAMVAVAERRKFATNTAMLRDGLESDLATWSPKTHIFSGGACRLPNTSCFAVEGLDAEFLLMALDLEGIAVSSGSACSSGKVAPSHVLAAMGVPQGLANAALRISFGWNSTAEDVARFVAAWTSVLGRLGHRAAA